MTAVDFSSRHHILIRRKDGRLVPMDEPCYEVTGLAPGVWQIMSSGDYHYLLEGDDEAVSIDTGYGAGNLREFLETLTSKPVRSVIDTHHHFDHTANNYCFELAYMARETEPLAAIPYPSFAGIEFPRDYEVRIVEDGDIIPLKGRELEIFRIGDHTPGGIAILDRKSRLLFTGDEIMPGGKNINDTVEKFRNDMAKLAERRGEFDRVCGGPEILDGEEVDIFLEAAEKILAGERSNGENRRRPPFRKPEESGGPLVYDCQHPHPEDVPGPAGPGPGGPGERGQLVWKGRNFMFYEDRLR